MSTLRDDAHEKVAREPKRRRVGAQRTPAANGPDAPPEAVLTQLSTVAPEPVTWLWPGWLPSASLCILDGDPGLAKSQLTLDLAARISRGWQMPPGGGGEGTPRGVLLLSAEDGLAQTIRPRLDAAGADCARVHAFRAVTVAGEERPVVLPFDLRLVEEMVRAADVALLVVDPFAAYLGSEFDAHKDQDVRRCLYQLHLFAEKLGVCILLIRHLNKLGGGAALYRGMGSIGIVGAGRAALIAGRDPEDPERRILAMNKINIAKEPVSLAYRLEPVGDVTRIAWEGECDLNPEDILWHPQGRSPGRSDDQAHAGRDFLRQVLAGGPRPVAELKVEAEAAGLSWRTVERARALLRLDAHRVASAWCWELPPRQLANTSGTRSIGELDPIPTPDDEYEEPLPE